MYEEEMMVRGKEQNVAAWEFATQVSEQVRPYASEDADGPFFCDARLHFNRIARELTRVFNAGWRSPRLPCEAER
jgi:hypothetical protein